MATYTKSPIWYKLPTRFIPTHMRQSDFSNQMAGCLVPTIAGQLAFVPAPLPPQLSLEEIGLPMSEAMQALGELRGACRRLANPDILIRPLQRQEALTSSAMEGTFTTADNLLLAEAGVDRKQDDSTREVINYISALNGSIHLLKTLPISHRVIQSAHRILLGGLSNARGVQKLPGEYKRDQNWIGGRTIEAARFVPPPPAEAIACMNELERYINRDRGFFPTPLVDLALVHYQMEAIHPFADGNGRVGRMLISLMAVETGLLDMPVLYISPAMEDEKDTYIDLMFNVSTRGEWAPWLNFFFGKVCEACTTTVATIDRLIDLQVDYRQRASAITRSANAITLVDMLFEQPALTVAAITDKLSITYAAARKTIDKLVEIKILAEFPGAYPKTYVAPGILQAARSVPVSPREENEPRLL